LKPRSFSFVELGLLLLMGPVALFWADRYFWVLSVIPLIWLARWRLLGRLVDRTPLDLAVLVMLAMLLVSQYVTFDIQASVPKSASLIWGIGCYYAAVSAIGASARGLAIGLGAYVLAGLALALLALVGTNWSGQTWYLSKVAESLPRFAWDLPGATNGFNPNEVAGTLLWCLPLTLALLHSRPRLEGQRRRGSRLLQWAFMAGLVVSVLVELFLLLLTYSRGAWLGLGLALIAMGAVWGRRLRGALLVAGLAALLLTVGWIGTGLASPGEPTEALFSTTGLLSGRIRHWERALYAIQMYPYTGVGINMYRQMVHLLYPVFQVPMNSDIPHAHNEYLQAALDLGLPGLIALMSIYFGAFWMLVRALRCGRGPHLALGSLRLGVGTIALGAAGGLLAHASYGLTDAVALGAKPGVIFWFLLALVAAIHRHTLTEASRS
jgi:O-antigen ligase